MRRYRDLIAWQASFDLAKAIYAATERFPRDEQFGLKLQLRRGAVSVMSNIAEGAGRSTKKDFAHFITVARSALNETESQWLLAQELGFAKSNAAIDETIERLFGLLNGLRNSLNAQR